MPADIISGKERNESSDSVSIRDYIDAKYSVEIKRLDQVSQITHQAVAQATLLANDALNKRLEGMNEFRQQMNDQTRSFLAKEEYSARHEALEKRISGLEKVVWGAVGAMVFIEALAKFFKG